MQELKEFGALVDSLRQPRCSSAFSRQTVPAKNAKVKAVASRMTQKRKSFLCQDFEEVMVEVGDYC